MLTSDVIGFAIVGTDPKRADANNTDMYPNNIDRLFFLRKSNDYIQIFVQINVIIQKTITRYSLMLEAWIWSSFSLASRVKEYNKNLTMTKICNIIRSLNRYFVNN